MPVQNQSTALLYYSWRLQPVLAVSSQKKHFWPINDPFFSDPWPTPLLRYFDAPFHETWATLRCEPRVMMSSQSPVASFSARDFAQRCDVNTGFWTEFASSADWTIAANIFSPNSAPFMSTSPQWRSNIYYILIYTPSSSVLENESKYRCSSSISRPTKKQGPGTPYLRGLSFDTILNHEIRYCVLTDRSLVCFIILSGFAGPSYGRVLDLKSLVLMGVEPLNHIHLVQRHACIHI